MLDYKNCFAEKQLNYTKKSFYYLAIGAGTEHSGAKCKIEPIFE